MGTQMENPIEFFQPVMDSFKSVLMDALDGMDTPKDPEEIIVIGGKKRQGQGIGIHWQTRIIFFDYIWLHQNLPNGEAQKMFQKVFEEGYVNGSVHLNIDTLQRVLLLALSEIPMFEGKDFEIRFINFPTKYRLLEITSADTGKFAQIRGIPISRSGVAYYNKVTQYQCLDCGNVKNQYNEYPEVPKKFNETCENQIGEPTDPNSFLCPSKNYKKLQDVEWLSYMNVQIEATNEEATNKNEPATFHLEFLDNITKEYFLNRLIIGEMYDFWGVIKVRNINANRHREVPHYVSYLEVHGFRKVRRQEFSLELTEEEEKQLVNFMRKDDSLEIMSQALGSRVVGFDREKKAFVLTKLEQEYLKRSSTARPQNHILHMAIIGDYSTGKSELKKVFLEICDNGYEVQGGHTSKAGLVGATVKDELTGQYGIQPGVLARASGDTLVIEEFDKARNKEDVGALNEVMSGFKYVIAKGGKNRTFHSVVSVVIIANPVGKKFDEDKSVLDQIPMEGDLLSRCSFVSIVKQKKSIERQRLIDRAIMARNNEELYKKDRENAEKIKKCIKIASKFEVDIDTPLVREALDSITKKVHLHRKMGLTERDSFFINLTPRHKNTFITIIKAVARWHLHRKPTESDIQEAYSLMISFWRDFIDYPDFLNVDEIEQGKTLKEMEAEMEHQMSTKSWEIRIEDQKKSKHGRITLIKEKVKRLCDDNEQGMADVLKIEEFALQELDMAYEDFQDIYEKLKTEGIFYEPRKGFVKMM